MKKLLGIIFISLMWCNIGSAGLKVDSYLKAREGKNKEVNEFIDNSIQGIGTGIFWSNTSIKSDFGKANNEKPMYCPPQKLVITKENYINFLNAEIKEHKEMGILTGEEPIAMMIVMHLRKIFPCE
mgnify:CR=1 FL=1